MKNIMFGNSLMLLAIFFIYVVWFYEINVCSYVDCNCIDSNRIYYSGLLAILARTRNK